MKAVFLGTGTSCGVPIIGCDCAVCRSDDPRNKRRRTSLWLEAGDVSIVVDTSADFRDQVLSFGVKRLDAVLITHAHADHIFGLDDIRRFNTMQGGFIPVYGSESTIADLQRVFNYVNHVERPGLYRPLVDFRAVFDSFRIGRLRVTPLAVDHGPTPTYAYRFDCAGKSIAYAPDCAAMSDEVIEQLQGLDVMILDGLRNEPHSTHLTVEDSIAYLRRIGACKSFITHLTHDLEHETTQAELPDGINVPYDGLTLEW